MTKDPARVRQGTPVRAPTYGLVLVRGKIARGGRVVVLVGPKLRLHYFAHLDSIDVYPATPGCITRRVSDPLPPGRPR